MMPAFALVGIPPGRRLPPVPVPLFCLWPLVPFCLGIARLLDPRHPTEAAQLRAAIRVFREMRGLVIDVDAADRKQVRIRLI